MLPSRFEALTEPRGKTRVLLRQVSFDEGSDMVAVLRREGDNGLADYDLFTATVDAHGGVFLSHLCGVEEAAEYAGVVVPGVVCGDFANVWVRDGKYHVIVSVGHTAIECEGSMVNI